MIMNAAPASSLRYARWMFLAVVVFYAASGLPALGQDRDRASPDAISVEVASGRVFTGRLDPMTDQESLYLHSGRDRIRITRPIRWTHVVAVHAVGHTVAGDVFRQIVEDVRGNSLPGDASLRANTRVKADDDPTQRTTGA